MLREVKNKKHNSQRIYKQSKPVINDKDFNYDYIERIGKDFSIINPGVDIKKYPVCYASHAAVDGINSILKSEKNVFVPDVIDNLSTDRLLTMTWLEGDKLLGWLERNPDLNSRNNVAVNMFKAWYIPFYFYGVIHGDPHLGNYSISDSNTYR